MNVAVHPPPTRRQICESRFAGLRPADPLKIAEHLSRPPIGVDALYPDPWPRVALVVFNPRPRLFDFADDVSDDDDEAVDALIFLAIDELGEPDDLVAYAEGHPTCAWYDHAAFLGAENLLGPRLHDHGLYVHKTPLDWLAFRQEGVVIIDMRRARLRLIDELLCVTDGPLAEALNRQLRIAPKISVLERAHG
jgi:hypothetical protein